MQQGGPKSLVVVAIGGNAIAPSGRADEDQRTAVKAAMEQVALVLQDGHDVVLTHGNGPQVGHLLMQNELARDAVPGTTLDICVAQTQASIGLMMTIALEDALAHLNISRPVATLLTRVRVSSRDRAWSSATKPIGGFLDDGQRNSLMLRGEVTAQAGSRWRRVVPSPDPLEVVDTIAIGALLSAGVVPIVAGGGGIPGVRKGPSWHGVEAVLDKDLTAALLGSRLGADCLVIATDVSHVVVHYGRPEARPLRRVTSAELRTFASVGHFPPGSMGPKVEAAARFVEMGGHRSVITSVSEIRAGVDGVAGTIVESEGEAA